MFIMNLKIRSRKISLKIAYFRAILHYFGLHSRVQRRMDSGVEAESFVIRYFIIPALLVYPVIHDSFTFFFEIHDSLYFSFVIQKAENDLKLYMLFCFAPCVKLMFWYKI